MNQLFVASLSFFPYIFFKGVTAMRKKFIVLLLFSLAVLNLAAFPATPAPGGLRIYVNNSRVFLDDSPIIREGSTFIPLRAFFQALGAEVAWEEETGTVHITLAERSTGDKEAAETTGPATQQPADREPEHVSALTPRGQPPPLEGYAMPPRLDSLEGKTLYLVDIGYPGADILFDELDRWFAESKPETTVVVRDKYGDYFDDDPALWEEIQQKGDAVVMGIGH